MCQGCARATMLTLESSPESPPPLTPWVSVIIHPEPLFTSFSLESKSFWQKSSKHTQKWALTWVYLNLFIFRIKPPSCKSLCGSKTHETWVRTSCEKHVILRLYPNHLSLVSPLVLRNLRCDQLISPLKVEPNTLRNNGFRSQNSLNSDSVQSCSVQRRILSLSLQIYHWISKAIWDINKPQLETGYISSVWF